MTQIICYKHDTPILFITEKDFVKHLRDSHEGVFE